MGKHLLHTVSHLHSVKFYNVSCVDKMYRFEIFLHIILHSRYIKELVWKYNEIQTEVLCMTKHGSKRPKYTGTI